MEVCRAVAAWAATLQTELTRSGGGGGDSIVSGTDSETDTSRGERMQGVPSALLRGDSTQAGATRNLAGMSELQQVKAKLDLSFVSNDDIYNVRPRAR